MNKLIVICLFSLFVLFSCTREKTVIEATFPDGSPKKVCIYKGKEDARELIRETTYYPKKKIQMEGTFKNNLRDGRWVYYYENGKIWSEGFFKDGKNEGKRTTYFENGRIRYEAYYKDDVRVGKWQFFNEKGQLLQIIDYDAPADTIKK
jgi:antitoxin component YwqK of YwqJK toxin-antitoxin module